MRLFKPNVKKMQHEKDIAGLIGLLKNKRVYTAAREALVELGAPAVGSLIIALGEQDSNVRRMAAWALSDICDIRAVEPLIVCLRDEDWIVRNNAAHALGRIGDDRAIGPLTTALDDRQEDVRREAVIALHRIGGTRTIRPLIAALNSHPKEVRQLVACALGDIGDMRVVVPLIRYCHSRPDDKGTIRHPADVALRKIAQRNPDALILALQDTPSGFGMHCRFKILGFLDDLVGWQPGKDEFGAIYWIAKEDWQKCAEIGTAAIEPLLTALEDWEWQQRITAARALGEIGDARAREPLLAAIAATSGDWRGDDFREAAGQALKKIGSTPKTKPTSSLLDDSDPDVRKIAAEIMGESGDERAVEPLIAALRDSDHWVRKEAAQALGKLGDARAVEPLVGALEDENVDMRVSAARALRILEGKRAVEGLICCLKDSDDSVRYVATSALVQIGDKRAASAVIDALLADVGQVATRKNTWSPDECRNLFEDYADLVVGIAAEGRIKDRSPLPTLMEEMVDISKMAEALKELCEIDSPITSNVLHQVLDGLPEEVTYVERGVDWAEPIMATTSFEPLREIARQELAKRGNPNYDPYEYEKEEAWEY